MKHLTLLFLSTLLSIGVSAQFTPSYKNQVSYATYDSYNFESNYSFFQYERHILPHIYAGVILKTNFKSKFFYIHTGPSLKAYFSEMMTKKENKLSFYFEGNLIYKHFSYVSFQKQNFSQVKLQGFIGTEFQVFKHWGMFFSTAIPPVISDFDFKYGIHYRF